MTDPEAHRSAPRTLSERRPTVGGVLLVLGWTTVAIGAVVAVLGQTGSGGGRAETTGVGLAVVMVGMLIVLAGNYAHHRDDPPAPRDPE
jgi:hypothetical protein